MSALGGGGRGVLEALGAGGAGGSAPDPEEILSQIRQLLDEYLALGPNTPVAAQAQALSDAIDQQQGGQPQDQGAPPVPGGPEEAVPGEEQAPAEEPDQGMPPPEDGGGAADLPPQDEMPQDNTQLGPGEKGYSGGDHKEARAQATDFLKKRNKKGK
jgi:hypothetical protein